MSTHQSPKSRAHDVVPPLDVLSLCEGFRVESADGHVGVVSALRHPPSARLPNALAVRLEHSSKVLLIVQAPQVESVSLAERRIVLRSPHQSIAATERVSASEPATESPERSEAKARSADEDSRAYWLRTCEGFRVYSKDGQLGVVEEVRCSNKQPEALAVRTGLFRTRLLIVPVDEVKRIVPREKRVFLRSTTR
jgi:hypothetical protein